mmetsp:Transcript_34235/g.47024  ORF Transcript_34235/g.47024 Transcript_34235/m.47024 type:complete len:89 (+) Transcript_34235:314-580(+)
MMHSMKRVKSGSTPPKGMTNNCANNIKVMPMSINCVSVKRPLQICLKKSSWTNPTDPAMVIIRPRESSSSLLLPGHQRFHTLRCCLWW